MQRRYKGSGGEVVNKRFNYCDVFGNQFCYSHQVNNNTNICHSPIYLEINWATNYWPDCCHDYFLALTEHNVNYLRGYLVDGVDVEPQFGFWCQLGWTMVENTLYEQERDSKDYGIRIREKRGSSGDHELMTAPKYCVKWLVEENKWRRVKQTHQKKLCANSTSDCKNITRRY